MALSGVHIAFGAAIGFQNGLFNQPSLPYLCTSSETMVSAGISTICAGGDYVQALLSISASAPIFYAVGPDPDITGPDVRYYDPALGREDIIVNSGDFFAWGYGDQQFPYLDISIPSNVELFPGAL
jgi:hypothetical protein